MSKMTDNHIADDGKKDKEIINFIKEYVDWAYDTNIAKLTYDEINDFYDLVMRQQKQLENYSHNVRNMSKDFIDQQKIIQEQQAEIERLKADAKRVDKDLEELDRPLIEIKAEAIKEVVERLKTLMFGKYCDYFNFEITNAIIDSLVKEMVGEGK